MDYEQKYFDLLYENKKIKNEIKQLENDINLLKNKNYIAIIVSYERRVHAIKEEVKQKNFLIKEIESLIKENPLVFIDMYVAIDIETIIKNENKNVHFISDLEKILKKYKEEN